MVKCELLAPVGNFEMLHSAIAAGADSVYFGIKGFNMREGARNFKLGDLKKIQKICLNSTRKVKRYLTLNTVVYDSELKNIEKLIKKAKEFVDAIICWDPSIVSLCKKYTVPIHISTQASVSNIESAEFYKKMGAERFVLARELNLKQIKKISNAGYSIECFAHGAMCVAVSGRCFTSQFLHGTSANRGRCAHPCRRAWTVFDDSGNELKLDNNKVMSAKDLCTLPFIEEMKSAGITSFKIEGRNRSPEYVYAVTKIYRKALDKKLNQNELKEGINELKKVYNRGFSEGFYFKMPTADDFSYSENGEQTEFKEYIGRVEKYWPKFNSASVKIHHKGLNVGDDIYIISKERAIEKVKIESIELDAKKVSFVGKCSEAGIKLPKCSKGDEIYLIKEKRE